MTEEKYRIQCDVGGKICELACDKDASTTHVKEALFQFIKHVCQIEDQAKISKESEPKSKDVVKEPKKE